LVDKMIGKAFYVVVLEPLDNKDLTYTEYADPLL